MPEFLTSIMDELWLLYGLVRLDALQYGEDVLKAVSSGLVIYLLGRLFIYSWREHSYLYQLEDRTHAVDNWVNLLVPYVRRVRLSRYRALLTRDLARSAFRPGWDSSHFMAYQALWGIAFASLSFVFLVLILGWPTLLVVVASGYGIFLPYSRLSSTASARFLSCRRDLPFFIDYLTLSMGAGLDFNRALARVVEDAPRSPLTDEFKLVLRKMRLGDARAAALVHMEKRLDSPQLKLFVQTMVQAMELGTDVVKTLQVMSETFQQKRFQLAEEEAGKISVRMMMPLMLFVLPAVMIILIAPMFLDSPLFSGF